MSKKHSHPVWLKIRNVKPWYFLILAVISSVICIYTLRNNNTTMVSLRNDVYKADETNGNVEGTLQTLQAYVTSHMNTNLSSGSDAVYPPIQLKYTYERLQAAQAQQADSSNTQIYTEAQTYCQQQDSTDFSGRNRVPCIEQFVESHGIKVPTIPASLYEFDFISPRWSPDTAGWTLLLSVALFIIFIVSWIAERWFKRAKE